MSNARIKGLTKAVMLYLDKVGEYISQSGLDFYKVLGHFQTHKDRSSYPFSVNGKESDKRYDTFFDVKTIQVTIITLKELDTSDEYSIDVKETSEEHLSCLSDINNNLFTKMPPIFEHQGETMSLVDFDKLTFPNGGSLMNYGDRITQSFENGIYDKDYSKTGLLDVSNQLNKFAGISKHLKVFATTNTHKYAVTIACEADTSSMYIRWRLTRYIADCSIPSMCPL